MHINDLPDNSILLADGDKGIYIPWLTAQLNSNDRLNWHNLNNDDVLVLLEGPSHPEYWEAWDNVLNTATVTVLDVHNRTYSLYEDQDLWLIPVDAEWPEE